MTPFEALRRYHGTETRLAEVEKEIRAHAKRREWRALPLFKQRKTKEPRGGTGDLQSLYLERERLQAESFRVFMEARRLG